MPASGCSLVIVGGGPLCTYALERLAALLPDTALAQDLRIAVFERSGRFGAGETHSELQPATSYMNRVAGQIALAADETDVCKTSQLQLTFLEWCEQKLRATGDARFALGARDIPPRWMHGLALREAFDRYVALLRRLPRVTVTLHPHEVTDLTPTPNGPAPYRVEVDAAPQHCMAANHVLLVTGHSSQQRPAPRSCGGALAAARHTAAGHRYIRPAYPLECQLTEETVPPGCTVGIDGLGLTAIDVVLHLTEGRGGTFTKPDSREPALAYVPSGREPARIVGASPSGMLPHCRAINEKAEHGRSLDHVGIFLTHAAIHTLRRSVGRPALPAGARRCHQLDFELHVFPLLIMEMAYVYYRTLLGDRFARTLRTAAQHRYATFLQIGCETRDAGVKLLLEPLQACFGRAARREPALATWRFAWQRIFEPLATQDSTLVSSWHERLVTFMQQDIANAAQGNLRNPVKAACDSVWRDLRPVLCEAVDRGGLTAVSQRRFMAVYLRYYNRLSNGAGLGPMRRMLALAEGGVLDLATGPAPVIGPGPTGSSFRISGPITGTKREVDVLIHGQSDPFVAARDAHPLYPNLLRRKLVRPWRNPGRSPEEDFVPGGLDLCERFHPLRDDGTPDTRLTFLGAPASGLMHFHQTAARPHACSSPLETVARWADELIAMNAVARLPAPAAR